ncbi:recombinase family protein [Priestia aryabhattai]|uniref:recombinase family protein n=1 Tax=Priestia aryabhattai TaxID=412384 RepID=UPI003D27AFE4
MKNNNGNTYGYARVSTTNQDFTSQVNALMEAGISEENIFTDKITGTKMKRTGLDELLDKVESGDVIVVWKLDRLGRSLSQVTSLLDKLTKRKIYIRSIADGVDTSNNSPMATAMMQLLAMFAEMERNFIVARTKPAIQKARAEGRDFGRKETNKKLYDVALDEYMETPEDERPTFKTLQERYGRDPQTGKYRLGETSFFRKLAERRAVDDYINGRFPEDIPVVEDTDENKHFEENDQGEMEKVDNPDLEAFRGFLKKNYMSLKPNRFIKIVKEFKKKNIEL